MSIKEKREILMQKLFSKMSKKKAKSKAFYLPLKVNNILHDEIFVKIDNQENILLSQDTIIYVLSLIKEEYKTKFKFTPNKKNFITLKNLEQFGIITAYDAKNIILNITLPAKLKKTSRINFNPNQLKDQNNTVLTERYSGGANLYLNQYYNKTDSDSFQKNSLNLSSDWHLNLNNLILEGQIHYEEERHTLNRGAIRVLTDDKERLLRYEGGDIILPSHNRLSYLHAMGFGVEKFFNIGHNQQQNSSRINMHEFFLKHESTVEVYVNGHYKNLLHLTEGTHNLFDFNLPSGLNSIKLKVIEKSGKIEYIEFDDFSYSELLKKGLFRYGYGFGVQANEQEGQWHYNQNHKVASAYLEYGLFHDMTIEGGIQKNNKHKLADIELLIGTNLGLFNPYLIQSKINNKTGYKKGMEFRSNIGEGNINLSYEQVDENYQTGENSHNQQSTIYAGNFYSQIGMGINIGIGTSYLKTLQETETTHNLVFRKNFNALAIELDLEQRERKGKKKENKIYASIEYRFDAYSSRYTNNFTQEEQQVNLKYTSRSRYGLNSDVLLTKNTESQNFGLRSDLHNEKFNMNSSYNISTQNNSNLKNENIGVQLATGIVFAGGKATITAPINSSFVIVDNDDRLEKPLGIKSQHDAEEFTYDRYAIELSDYEERELVIEESNLDFGIDLKDFKESFKSNYRSASIMNIDVQNFYSIKGVFHQKENGKPLANKAFRVFNLQSGEKTTSFTNKKGAFIINHIDIGTYNISFSKEKKYKTILRHSFTIDTKNQESLIDMGDIYLTMPKRKEIKKLIVFKPKK